MKKGLKYDEGKPRLALVPPKSINAIGEVMTFGASKYYEGSWRGVEVWRYRDALMRHLVEYLSDPQSIATDSGLPHLWHVTANASILCDLENDILIERMKENESGGIREDNQVSK